MDNGSNNKTAITLAIETSGRVGSVAVGRGDQLLAESTFSGFMKHSSELFGQLQALLDGIDATAAEVTDIAITAGPGSFTGLRIAVTVAKMMAFARRVNIVAVDAMAVLADNAADYNRTAAEPFDCVATIIDAKRDLFFASVFARRDAGWHPLMDTQMVSANALLDRLARENKPRVAVLGEGLLYYAKQFESPQTTILDPAYWPARAGALFALARQKARQGQFADPAALAPLYIRRPEAVENWEKRNNPAT